jgi:hypothetical protein
MKTFLATLVVLFALAAGVSAFSLRSDGPAISVKHTHMNHAVDCGNSNCE